jgi:XTP/dITP diphosphohydrolase
MRLLLATRNPGILREMRELLSGLSLELTSLPELHIDVDIPEVGETFQQNATLKAEGYARLAGLATLADDSGLEVDALGGEPGVHSARWAGPHATDQQRIDLLLEQLQGVPPAERQAQFRCVVAVAAADDRLYTAEGIVRGLIIDRPRGSHGFGYDPVFLLPELGLTMAELPTERKNRISHRARAVQAIRPVLAVLAAEGKDGRACV